MEKSRTDNRNQQNDGVSNERTNQDKRSVNQNQKSGSRITDHSMLTGMFRDRQSTENAYNALHDRGYTKDDINIMMSDDTRKKQFSEDVAKTELGTKAAEGTGKGAAIGGTVGAIAGIVAAIGTSIVIPGLGLIIAGPIAAGLAGAGAGGITGGVIGALVGAGIPEERARIYESGVKSGNIVMGVHPRNDEDAKYFEDNWRTNKAEEIHN